MEPFSSQKKDSYLTAHRNVKALNQYCSISDLLFTDSQSWHSNKYKLAKNLCQQSGMKYFLPFYCDHRLTAGSSQWVIVISTLANPSLTVSIRIKTHIVHLATLPQRQFGD